MMMQGDFRRNWKVPYMWRDYYYSRMMMRFGFFSVLRCIVYRNGYSDGSDGVGEQAATCDTWRDRHDTT